MSQALHFLTALCGKLDPDEHLEIRTFHRGDEQDGKPGPRRFDADAVTLARFVAGCTGPLDIYYGVDPRRKGQGGKKEAVSRVLYLHIDLDDKHFADGRAGAVAALNAFPLPPTWVIATGGGLQVLWALAEPLVLSGPDDPQIAEVEGIIARLAVALGNLDKTHDISRVFRLPGSRNYKYPDAPEVLIRHEDEAAYTLAEFAALLPAPEPTHYRPRPHDSFDDSSAEEVREMLRYIPPQGHYSDWVRVGAGLHSAFPGPDGEALWEGWSPGKPGEVAAKFKSFGRYRGVRGPASLGTIVYLARQGGWRPLPKRAPTFAMPAADGVPDRQGETATSAREAALVEENAQLRAALLEERQARAGEKAVHLRIMATLKLAQLSASERLTAIALATEVANRATAGELDERGGATIRGYQLAQKTAQSVDTCRKHVNTFAAMGIIEKETRSGGRATYTDPITGQEVTKPVSDTIIVTQGTTVVDILETFIAAERPESRNHGGKRTPCPRCGSQRRRTVVTCADCDLEFSNKVSEPAPEEETVADVSERSEQPASIPPTPVEEIAATYPTEYAASETPLSDAEADDWDPHFCNHVDHRGQQCTARIDPALGKRYCWQHQRGTPAPVVSPAPPDAPPPPPLDPAIAGNLAGQYDAAAIVGRLARLEARWEAGDHTPTVRVAINDWQAIAAARAAGDD